MKISLRPWPLFAPIGISTLLVFAAGIVPAWSEIPRLASEPTESGAFLNDAVDCPVEPPASPRVTNRIPPTSRLEEFAELDRIVRQGCAPKQLQRTWHDARQRLAPFTTEPDPDWRLRATETARSLPLVTPAGEGWTSIGPRNQGGRVTSILIDPRDENVLYVATSGGGVWKTTDAALTWTPLTDQLDSMSSGALVFDPVDPDTIYYGTGEAVDRFGDPVPGAGVYKSTDAGVTWSKAGSRFSSQIMSMAIVPTTPQTILAASKGGIYRSTDAGATWTRTLTGVASDVVVQPGSTTIVFAALGEVLGDNKNGIYKSTQAGASGSWVKLEGNAPRGGNTGRIELAIGTSSPETLIAGVQDASSANWLGLYGVWKTTDAGTNWARLETAPAYCSNTSLGPLTQCFFDNIAFIDPSNAERIYLGGIDIYRSLNGGASFSKRSEAYIGGLPYVHADQHSMAMSPTGVFWAGNDGGIYRSVDGGDTWEDRGAGLVSSLFYGIAQHPTAAFPLLGGLQDNGTQRYSGDPTKWKETLGGDGGFSAIDSVNPTIMYAEYVYLTIYKSTNGGSSFPNTPSVSGIPQSEREDGRTLFIAPFVIDPTNPNRLMAGTHKVYLTTTSAAGWSASSGDITENTSMGVSALAFSPTDSNTVWAGTESARVWVNKGLTTGGLWTNVTKNPLPGRYVTRIVVDPVDVNTVYVTYSGTGGGHVFVTRDGGTSWKDISGSLPDAPANGLAIDPVSTNRIWVATDAGVFYTEDDGARWGRYGDNFPVTRVSEIIFHKPLRLLRASTFGRGVWEASADFTVLYAPTAGFTYSPASPLTGSAVQFTDTSTGPPTSWAWSFGDGGTSTEQNPSHVYTRTGPATVSLTVTNPSGSSTTSRGLIVNPGSTTYTPQLIVPGQARAAGSGGAFFKSSFWMTNPGTTDTKVRLKYVPVASGSTGGATSPKDVTIGPNKSIAYANVLTDLFGATSDTSGVIVVEVATGNTTPLVTSRTFNDAGASGTFGQYIPGVPVAGGGSGGGGGSDIHGLGGNAQNRSNVGVVNLSASSTLTASLSVHDTTGTKVGNDVTVTVPPQSAVQTNRVNEVAGAGQLAVYSVKVASTGSFFSYTSKLDNKTSDPIFIPGTLTAKSTQWIDGVAAATGAGSTFFRSNLSLTNSGTAAAAVSLEFTKRGESVVSNIGAVSLQPGESRFYIDALSEIFGTSGSAGALAIKTAATTPIVAWCRTYNDLGSGNGTFGQFIPGFGSADLIKTKGAIFQGLSENASFRTNMGFVNTSSVATTVTVSVWRTDGTKAGERVYSLAANQAIFVSRVMNDILGSTNANIADGYVKVIPATDAVTYGWASSVDNTSTDQTFVRPLAIP